jgi:hypothetical protein
MGFDFGGDFKATRSSHHGILQPTWELVVGSTFESPSCIPLANSSPLLKEERNPIVSALVSNGNHPLLSHWSRTSSAFSSHNHPMDFAQVEHAEIFEQWLDRKEAGPQSIILLFPTSFLL